MPKKREFFRTPGNTGFRGTHAFPLGNAWFSLKISSGQQNAKHPCMTPHWGVHKVPPARTAPPFGLPRLGAAPPDPWERVNPLPAAATAAPLSICLPMKKENFSRVGEVEAVGNPCCPPVGRAERAGASLWATVRVIHGRSAGGGAPPPLNPVPGVYQTGWRVLYRITPYRRFMKSYSCTGVIGPVLSLGYRCSPWWCGPCVQPSNG